MFEGSTVGLASNRVREEQKGLIESSKYYTKEQKEVLLGILNKFEEEVINKTQEINFNSKLNSNEKQALLRKIDERYNYLESLYKTKREEFDNQIGPKKR